MIFLWSAERGEIYNGGEENQPSQSPPLVGGRTLSCEPGGIQATLSQDDQVQVSECGSLPPL